MADDLGDEWEVADRLSDTIIELVHLAIDRMKAEGRIEPAQLLAGQLLALLALLKTMPPSAPMFLTVLQVVVEESLSEVMKREEQRRKNSH